MSSLPVRGELVLALILRGGTDGVTTTQDVRRVLDPRRGNDDTEYGTLTRDELTGDWSYTFRKLDEMDLIERDMDVTTENGGQGPPPVTLTDEGEAYARNLIEAKKWSITSSDIDETLESLGTDLSALYRRVGAMETSVDNLEEGLESIEGGSGEGVESEVVDELHARINEVAGSVREVHDRVDDVDDRLDSARQKQKRISEKADHTEQLTLGILKMVEEDVEGRYGICLDCGEWSELATENTRREGYCLEHAMDNRMLKLDQVGNQIIPEFHSQA